MERDDHRISLPLVSLSNEAIAEVPAERSKKIVIVFPPLTMPTSPPLRPQDRPFPALRYARKPDTPWETASRETRSLMC